MPSLPQYIDGNQLTLLTNGVEYFPALLAALELAQRVVFVETYLFAEDATGRSVAAALARAATRGVQVHLLLDGFGARDFAPRLRDTLVGGGVQILIFRPRISPLTLRRSRLRRMHRKIVCIDATIAFVGGINVIDDDDTPGQIPPRYDYAVQIEGPLATHISSATTRLWTSVAWANSGRRLPQIGAWRPWRPLREVAPRAAESGSCRAALVVRDSLHHRRDIEDAYLDRIAAARSEILIANAYFFPGWRFRRALRTAAKRGVHVVLLLQGRVEYVLLHYAAHALYRSLLKAGIEIHEYHRSFLHAKVAVFDSEIATIGSSNIDPFSFLMAKEANVFIADAQFARQLRESLSAAIAAGARQVQMPGWRQLDWWLGIRNWLAYGTVRLAMTVAGYWAEIEKDG